VTSKAIFAEAFWKVLPNRPVLSLTALFHPSGSEAHSRLISEAHLDLENLPDIAEEISVKSVVKQLRPQHWLKNALLFLPILASHNLEFEAWLRTLLGFLVFSLLASSIYILNDLLDLEADRAHPTKKNRPIAKGDLSIRAAVWLFVILLSLAAIGGMLIGTEFAIVTAVYLILTTLYSFGLKSLWLIDILMLAGLFSIRVVAGAAASGVEASLWFLAFVAPVFLSLATVKRLTEVTLLEVEGKVPGRAYRKNDRNWLVGLGILSAVASVLVFILYTFSDAVAALYSSIWALQLATLPLILWLYRMIHTSWRGQQSYDPISFAMRDKIGLGLVAVAGALVIYAI